MEYSCMSKMDEISMVTEEFDPNAIPYLGGATTIQSNTEGIRKVLESSYSCFNTFGLHC